MLSLPLLRWQLFYFVLVWNRSETTSAADYERVQYRNAVSRKLSMLAVP